MEEQAAEKNNVVASSLEGDWFLRMLVDVVNRNSLRMTITLNVGSDLISGELVGGKEYFEGLASEISAKVPGDVGASVAGIFKMPAAMYDYDPNADDGTQTLPPAYIHLKNCRFFVPGQKPLPAQGVWWRGRLSEVSGFFIGTIQPN